MDKSAKLQKEIDDLIVFLYNTNTKDAYLKYENLKTYRTEILRSFILHLYLSLEDLLRAHLFDFLIKQNKTLTDKEAIKIAKGMYSSELIHWCGRLKLVTAKQYAHLLELNRIRNACVHNWILDIPKYKKVVKRDKRVQVKAPIVTFNNKNLFNQQVFTDDFLPIYGKLYLKLLFKTWKMQGKI